MPRWYYLDIQTQGLMIEYERVRSHDEWEDQAKLHGFTKGGATPKKSQSQRRPRKGR